jgi:hypothetical protein
MKYNHAVKANGKWYAAGEEVPEATAITDVEETVSEMETVDATAEDSSDVAEPEVVVSEPEKTTGKRKTTKK